MFIHLGGEEGRGEGLHRVVRKKGARWVKERALREGVRNVGGVVGRSEQEV